MRTVMSLYDDLVGTVVLEPITFAVGGRPATNLSLWSSLGITVVTIIILLLEHLIPAPPP